MWSHRQQCRHEIPTFPGFILVIGRHTRFRFFFKNAWSIKTFLVCLSKEQRGCRGGWHEQTTVNCIAAHNYKFLTLVAIRTTYSSTVSWSRIEEGTSCLVLVQLTLCYAKGKVETMAPTNTLCCCLELNIPLCPSPTQADVLRLVILRAGCMTRFVCS